MQKKLFLMLLFFFSYSIHSHAPRQIWRIIHGTFARDSKWYQPGGVFFETLKKNLPENALLKSFTWSGKNKDEERTGAAHQLITDIATYDHPDDEINIIAHSHGCNVAIRASQELAKHESLYKINRLITLAPPICRSNYGPEMDYINTLYNFFSFGDRIQPVFQIFQRTYDQHPHIFNIEITLNNQHPEHSLMHDPCVAEYLPTIENYCLGNEETLIHFYSDKDPVSECDTTREKKLKDDKRFTEHMLTAMQFIRTFTPNKAVRYYAQEYYENLTKLAPKDWALRLRDRRDFNPQETAYIKYIEHQLHIGHSLSSLWKKECKSTAKTREDCDSTSDKPRD